MCVCVCTSGGVVEAWRGHGVVSKGPSLHTHPGYSVQ